MTSKNRREEFAAGLVKDGELAARKYLKRAASEQDVESLRGKTIVFEYPRHNIEHMPLEYKTRILRVDAGPDFAREFGSDPNDEAAIERAPFRRRIGKLIRGVDLAEGITKQFYCGAMRNVHVASPEEVMKLRRCRPAAVVLRSPDDWKPSDANDLPPGVEIHKQENALEAHTFAVHFNSDELVDPCGWWAVPIS